MESVRDVLAEIQGTLVAPKNLRNNFGNYNYRSCEGILESVKPLLKKLNATLLLTDEVKEVGGIVFCEATASLSYKTGTVEVKAQAGIPPVKKGMDLSQIFGASSSYARKYALNGLFLIDDNKDADTQDNRESKTIPQKGKFSPVQIKKIKEYVKTGGDLANVSEKYGVSVEELSLLITS